MVGLMVDRSAEMIVGMLGILKAGGAYVPLDPGYPAERLEWMLKDSGIGVLLTERKWLRELPAHRAVVLCLDEMGEGAMEEASGVGAGVERVRADQVAYEMYTSGSTGVPKGVAVRHRGIVRLVCGAEDAGLNEETVFLQLAPISFDASTLEIWGPLLNGGRCVVSVMRVPTVGELERGIEQRGVQ